MPSPSSLWHYFSEEGDDSYCRCLLLWWCSKKEENDNDSLPSPSSMAFLQKNATIIVITFLNGFVAKKVTITMSSPFPMVVVL
jgi:hypothetical protein